MAATEKSIKPLLQLTLFRSIPNVASSQPGPDKFDCYNQAYLACLPLSLLDHVGYGRQYEAETILKRYPDLLLSQASKPVIDITGKIISGTAFQYAMWAMDTHMCTMMLNCLPQNEQGEEIRKRLLEQAEAQIEHFSFQPLISALQTYVDNFDAWDAPQREAHWCEVVGLVKRDLPAHVRQVYCHLDSSFSQVPSCTRGTWPRALGFYNPTNALWEDWDAGLGRSWKCTGWERPGVERLGWVRADLAAINALCAARTADLNRLRQRLQDPIHKLDDVSEAPTCI
ncbi:hypothetical protein [Legionella sp. CNM-4043-24]|uniref:hypothetical protein n=1 Tax=Legionella sp. CNM-4043-24 TaxID=3421646 RepID=UPI00403A9FCB